MPVPKKKTSSSKRDMRRSHHGLEKKNTITCSQCGEAKELHKVCPSCGTYKGRKVVDKKEDK